MSEKTPPPSASPARAPLDSRLVQWLAVELILDSRARLVEGGAGGDTRIDLADVFVDLPAIEWCGRDAPPDELQIVQAICHQPDDDIVAIDDETTNAPLRGHRPRSTRALIIGGPGSGKSTVTTMVAQLFRHEQVRTRVDEIKAPLQTRVREVSRGLDALRTRLEIEACRDLLPLRVNLPDLSRWLAARDDEAPAQLLWQYLAGRATENAANCGLALEISSIELEKLARAYGAIFWIFDGLDEVPRSAGRDRVVAIVHAVAPPSTASELLVTTRPQGYEGELGDLNSFVLTEIPPDLALDYGRRLLRAWRGGEDPQLNERLQSLVEEFAKPGVQELVRSPLHATMATLLVASHGTLPNARHMLFEHYFETIFKRELDKKGAHGVRLEDKALLRALHARAGLVLHTRSQGRAGARPTLTPRELRSVLEAIFAEEGRSPEDAQTTADRMLRFAADRLVLILRVVDGGYAFGIRSLQEFFAGVALLEGDSAEVRRRLEAIALNPHWANVLGLIVSGLAVPGAGQTAKAAALSYTSGLCRALNEGALGGGSAAACVAGSRLAIAMLQETELYGGPWIHEPLWEIAFEAVRSPMQMHASERIAIEASSPGAASIQWNDDLEIHARLGAVAFQWKGGSPEKRLESILGLAAAILKADRRDKRGWLLLLAALHANNARAVQLADAHAPEAPEAAQEVFAATLAVHRDAFAPWMIDFMGRHSDWFSPGWFVRNRSVNPKASPPYAPFLLWRLPQLRRKHIWRAPLGVHVYYSLLMLKDAGVIWADGSVVNPPETPAWQAWQRMAMFHKHPAKETLADALEALASSEAWKDALYLSLMGWPLSACLDFVNDSSELTALAAAVRAGALGELEDWWKAETRWRNDPGPADKELTAWLAADSLPWGRDIACYGRVFGHALSVEVDDVYNYARGEASRACAVLLAGSAHQRRPLQWLRDMLRIYHDSDEAPAVTKDMYPLEVAKLGADKPEGSPYGFLRSIDLLLPDLSSAGSDSWFDLLDEQGRRGANGWALVAWSEWRRERLSSILSSLRARLAARPDQWGLVDAIWAVMNVLPEASLAGFRPAALPPDASARAQASAAAVELLAALDEGIEVAPEILGRLASRAEGFDLRAPLAAILTRRERDGERSSSMLLQMLDATTAEDEELRDTILAGIFQHLKRSATPAFATRAAWKEHHLPEPYLSDQPPEALPLRIVGIRELSNIRVFKDTPSIDAPFPTPAPDRGQWIVLVGENGSGKTTLLRALGLALADPTVATRLLDENLPFVRNGGDGKVAVELSTGALEITVRRDARTETIVPAGGEQPVRPWVVGYGVRRGNARGEKDRAPEWGPTGELHTLFDRPATLVNAVDWLLDLDRRVMNERRQAGSDADESEPRGQAAIWQSVKRALETLLHITELDPQERHVMVTHPELGRVRLDALSDGYLTTTGWVIDLIARWIQRQEDLGEAIGRDLLRQMTGIVLIDEIDLHLHPTWQMRIINDVRRLFPRLSFVVTTHNPLTLQGARPGEIFVMRRGAGGHIELTQHDIRPGHDVDRVLLEQFGILYTFDRDTRALLDQHRALLERGVGPQDSERVEVERKLAARLGRVGEVLTAERGGEADPPQPWSEEKRRLLGRYLKPHG